MRVALSTDALLPVVHTLRRLLEARGHTVVYVGPAEDGAEADWPLVTADAARQVASGDADLGIVCCWTGTGASIAANKVRGIRAALVHDAYGAQGARKWNHANVLALSLRLTTDALAEEILDAFLAEPLTDDAWNRTQIDRVAALDAAR